MAGRLDEKEKKMEEQESNKNETAICQSKFQRWVRRFYPAGMRIRIEYDIDYGINKRSGWSVAIDGSYLVQFDQWFIKALLRALWAYQWWEKNKQHFR